MLDSNLFLNIHEASELLRIAEPTLYDWVHKRKIPFRKHGSRLVFSRTDLENWSQGHAVPQTTPLTSSDSMRQPSIDLGKIVDDILLKDSNPQPERSLKTKKRTHRRISSDLPKGDDDGNNSTDK